MRIYLRTPAHERVLRRIDITPGPLDTDCWIFRGVKNNGGYGQVRDHGVTLMAHRVTWIAVNGPVPAGLELDHLCRVRPCVRPGHMEAVTHRENDFRGASPAITRHLTGVCVRGHQITPGVQCRTCLNDNERLTYQYLRSIGHSPQEATRLRGRAVHRHAAGVVDLRRGGRD